MLRSHRLAKGLFMPLQRHTNMRMLLAAASVSALCLPVAAAAQTPMNPIDYCRENSDGKSERIACLEAAVTGLMSGMAPTAEAMAEATGEEKPARKAEAQRPPADASSVDEVAEAPTGLGADQVERRMRSEMPREERAEADEADEVHATIVDYATTPLGKVLIFLDNGQLWRQRDSDRTKIRMSTKKKYTVRISEGAFSGYRVYVKELNRTFVAERLK